MKLTTIIFTTILLTISTVSKSQNKSQEISFTLQTDAFDFMAKGFSLWGSMNINKNRIFLVGGRNELPDFLNPQSDNFIETRTYFVQSGYVRFLSKPKGVFVGGELIFQQMNIKAKATNEELLSPVLRIAPVIGYEWTPFDKLPISIIPWICERFPIYSQLVRFDGLTETYKTANLNFVMGCNLGYTF